jgi:hypothetical protein
MRQGLIAACVALAGWTLAIGPVQTAAPAAPIFTFAQPFYLNLHHFLYVLGRAQNRTADRTRRAVAGAPDDQASGLSAMSAEDAARWQRAVGDYAVTWSRQDAVFDAPLYTLTKRLSEIKDGAPLTPAGAIDADTARTLGSAADLYRSVWWTRHSAANRARIASFDAAIRAHGTGVLAAITRAYGQSWPSAGFPVNVSAYTNWAGAYSTDNHVLVLSSLDPELEGITGLEILFHEASHQWDQAIAAALAAASRRTGVSVPAGLSHAMIFYTTGEAVRAVDRGYRTYAERNIWDGPLGRFKRALDAAWQPYLDGRGTMPDALDAVLRHLG